MKADTPTTVRVTAKHIRDALPGDCFKCAVAVAMSEATGDQETHVVERDWTLHVVVSGRYLVAPSEVRRFVYAYDGLGRTKTGRAKLPRKLAEDEDLAPFDFELPPLNDPEWQESCHGCEALFDPGELDDEGYCPDCLQPDI